MLYYNTRYGFKLSPTIPVIPGSIIAASCIAAVDLRKRKFSKFGHLGHRLLDPQLYMATLDPAVQPDEVARLASYPWFHGHNVPQYDSGQYKNPTSWKQQYKSHLVAQWTRQVPSGDAEIARAARAAVELELALGCEAIILPGPLTTVADQTFETELAWVDAGLQACTDLKVSVPVYATVAMAEAVLHNVNPFTNQLIHAISSQIAARQELAGAYVVFEQADPSLYVWTARDPLTALLVLIDDLHRGAGRKVIVNYFGAFGAVATAMGASVWSTGFFQSQRRFNLRAKSGRTRPRYYSLSLAGDIGVEDDIRRVQSLGFAQQLFTPTGADSGLRTALSKGLGPSAVPEWEYRMGNRTASQNHYMEVVARLGDYLQGLDEPSRITGIHEWLKQAVVLAALLREKGFSPAGPTDVVHQKVWLDVFEAWLAHTKQ